MKLPAAAGGWNAWFFSKGRACALFYVLFATLTCHAAATASGRNWRIDIASLHCDGNSLLVIGSRIRYLGPKGPVEAPVSRLVDGGGRAYLPVSLLWKSGDRKLAQWLSSGDITNVQSEAIGELDLRFDVAGATRELKLEFGDIRAFALTRDGACRSFLAPAQIKAPRKARPQTVEPGKYRVYRGTYPCMPKQGTPRTIEAEYPPQLPKELVVLGRGFLPSSREIDLPMGKAAVQPYAYSGADKPNAIEDAARRALAADFPEYRAGLASGRYFAFNWGEQRSRSGNQLDAIGVYAIRPCTASAP